MLFKNTAKIKEYAQIEATDFNTVKHIIAQIEDKHIQPILGTEYTNLNEAYTNAATETTLNAAHIALLEKCRRIIAPYLCYYYAPVADGALTDAGFRRMETNTHKTAYQYQLKNYMEANLKMAENATEALLSFLEANITDYTTWHDSEQFEEYRKLFIKTGTEFYKIFPTDSPFSIYWACRSKMFDIEQNEILPLLSNTLFEDLKNKSLDDTLTINETLLIGKLKHAIAHLAIAYSIPMLNMNIGRNGLTIVSQTPRSNNEDVSARSNADANAISHAQRTALANGKQWMQNAVAFMKDNATEFPDFPGNILTDLISSKKTHLFGLN